MLDFFKTNKNAITLQFKYNFLFVRYVFLNYFLLNYSMFQLISNTPYKARVNTENRK